MTYEMLKIEGMVLKPTQKAIKSHKVYEYWEFYLSELTELTEIRGLKNISKPVAEIASKITREKQVGFLLELISVVKKYDTKNEVNWQNTNRVVAKSRLYFEFLKTDKAKKIDAKYFEDPNALFRVSSMNDKIKHNADINTAFEVWVKDKLIQ